jgi:hypothetical protein
MSEDQEVFAGDVVNENDIIELQNDVRSLIVTGSDTREEMMRRYIAVQKALVNIGQQAVKGKFK